MVQTKMSVLRARSFALKTQEDIAKVLGINKRTYAKLEKQPENFTIAQARAFARAVNIPMDNIFFEPDYTLSVDSADHHIEPA